MLRKCANILFNTISRAAERAEGPWGKISRTKFFIQLIIHSRHGQLINDVGFMCLHASKYLSTLTMKVLLIILPKHSLVESRQCNRKRKIKKQREDTAQEGKNLKISWGPFSRKKFGAPGEVSPATPPPSLSGPDYLTHLV